MFGGPTVEAELEVPAIKFVPLPYVENALFSQPDLARSIRSLPERRILEGYRLVGKIESIREKFLIGQHHRCKIGEVPPLKDYK